MGDLVAMRCVMVEVEGIAAPAWLRRCEQGWRVGVTPIVRNRGLAYFGGEARANALIDDMSIEFGRVASSGAGLELLRILGNHGKRLLVTGASAQLRFKVVNAKMREGHATSVVPKVVGNKPADPEALAKLALRILLRVEASGNTEVLGPLIGDAAIRPEPWDDSYYRQRFGSLTDDVAKFAGDGMVQSERGPEIGPVAPPVLAIAAERDLSGLVVCSEPVFSEVLDVGNPDSVSGVMPVAVDTHSTYLSVNPGAFNRTALRSFLAEEVSKAVRG